MCFFQGFCRNFLQARGTKLRDPLYIAFCPKRKGVKGDLPSLAVEAFMIFGYKPFYPFSDVQWGVAYAKPYGGRAEYLIGKGLHLGVRGKRNERSIHKKSKNEKMKS